MPEAVQAATADEAPYSTSSGWATTHRTRPKAPSGNAEMRSAAIPQATDAEQRVTTFRVRRPPDRTDRRPPALRSTDDTEHQRGAASAMSVLDRFDLTGRTAVVTGGTKGLGE